MKLSGYNTPTMTSFRILWPYYVLTLIVLSSISTSGQELKFAKVAPYQEFRAHEIILSDAGNLYLISPLKDEIYSSPTGEQWTLLDSGGLTEIEEIHLFDDGSFAISQTDKLYVQNNGSWENVYSQIDAANISVSIKDDLIYVYDQGRIFTSDDSGLSFQERYTETDINMLTVDLYVVDEFIVYHTFDQIVFLDKDFNLIKKNSLNRLGIIRSLTFFDIADSGAFVYGTLETDGAVEPKTMQGAFYSADQGESYGIVVSGDCQQIYGGAIVGDDVLVSAGKRSLYVENISTGQLTSRDVEAQGLIMSNQNKTYIYTNYYLNELLDLNSGATNRLTPDLKFDLDGHQEFKVSRQGIVYQKNEHNLYRSDDRGNSWLQVDLNGHKALSIDVGTDEKLHVFTPGYYFYSDDQGLSTIAHPHNHLTSFSFQQNTVLYYQVAAFQDSIAYLFARGCRGLTNGAIAVTRNNGEQFNMDNPSIAHVDYIKLQNEMYGFNNYRTNTKFSSIDISDLSSEIVNEDVPDRCLPIDENLIHYNEPWSPNPSYISRDLGLTTEKLGIGPAGSIWKAEEYEGTYIHDRARIFKRSSLTSDYKELDVSAVPTPSYGFDMASDFDGNIYISSVVDWPNYNLYHIENKIVHQQEITGTLYFDENENCSFDGGEDTELAGWKVRLTGNNYDLTDFVNEGKYAFKVPIGEYTLSILSPNDRWIPCESEYSISITDTDQIFVQDIPVQTSDICSDFSVSVHNYKLRRCTPGFFRIDIRNNGTRSAEDVSAIVTTDPFLNIEESDLPFTTINDTTYQFDLGDLVVQENKRITLRVKVSCDAPLGQVHCFNVNVMDDELCDDSSSSVSTLYKPNVGPFDPNDMRVFNEAGHESIKFEAEDFQYYHVRFQNTGTDTAINVKVVSELDSSLDLSTLEMLGSSHDYTIQYNDGQELVMLYDNIMLPDSNVNVEASNGYFRFRIKPISTIEEGTELESLSDIFFDFNQPIRTNIAKAIIGESCETPIYTLEEVNLCPGESYPGYSRTGIYRDVLCSEAGCDTIRTLDLRINRNTSSRIFIDACQGQTVDGQSSNITIRDTIENVAGCDSILIQQYRFFQIVGNLITQNETICEGESLFGHTEPGFYTDTIASGNFCSIYETTLDVIPVEQFSEVAEICAGEMYNGYTESGIYVDTLFMPAECYSLLNLELIVHDNYVNQIDTTICEGEEFMGLTVEGEYEIQLETVNGCDSIIVVDLDVLPMDDAECLSSLDDLAKDLNYKIFPNPTTNVINITTDFLFTQIDLHDMNGQLLLQRPSEELRSDMIKLEDLNSGIYFISIKHEKGILVEKIIVL